MIYDVITLTDHMVAPEYVVTRSWITVQSWVKQSVAVEHVYFWYCVIILSVNLIVVLDRDVNYRAVTFQRALVMWVSTPWGICTGLGPSVWESLRLMEPSTTQMASTPNSWRTTNWYQHTCLPLYSVSSPLSYLSSKFLSFLPSQNTSALLF